MDLKDIIPVWVIDCSTGCSCCRGENYIEGPFMSRDAADAKVDEYRRGIGSPLGSQWAKNGCYAVRELPAEKLCDGRAIINDRVFANLSWQERLCDDYAV